MLIEACFEELGLSPMCRARRSLSFETRLSAGPVDSWQKNERAVEQAKRSNPAPRASRLREFPYSASLRNCAVNGLHISIVD